MPMYARDEPTDLRPIDRWDGGVGWLAHPEEAGLRASHAAVGDERLGVTLVRRPRPPRGALGVLAPERVLVGHGEGVFEDAAAALDDALSGARRRLPRALTSGLGRQVRALVAALGD